MQVATRRVFLLTQCRRLPLKRMRPAWGRVPSLSQLRFASSSQDEEQPAPLADPRNSSTSPSRAVSGSSKPASAQQILQQPNSRTVARDSPNKQAVFSSHTALSAQLRRGNADKVLAALQPLEADGQSLSPELSALLSGAYAATGELEKSRQWLERSLACPPSELEDAFRLLCDMHISKKDFRGLYALLDRKSVASFITEELLLKVLYNAAKGARTVKDFCFNVDVDALWRKYSFEPHEKMYFPLFYLYVRLGLLDKIVGIKNRLALKGLSMGTNCCSAIIIALCQQMKVKEAEKWLEFMKRSDIERDVRLYGALISATSREKNWKRAEYWFEKMKEDGFEESAASLGVMVIAARRAKQLTKAEEYFARIHELGLKPDKEAISAMIHALVEARQLERAVKLLEESERDGLVTDTWHYNTIVAGCARWGLMGLAQQLLDRMRQQGVRADVSTYTPVINYFAKRGKMDGARQVYDQMLLSDIRPTIATMQILLDGFSKVLDLDGMNWAFKEMYRQGLEPDKLLYLSLVSSFIRVGASESAAEILRHMESSSIDWDAESISLVMKTCASHTPSGSDVIDYLVRYTEKNGIPLTEPMYVEIIRSYVAQRRLTLAREYFDRMRDVFPKIRLDVVNELVKGYRLKGQLREAVELIELLLSQDRSPNAATFSLLAGHPFFETATKKAKRNYLVQSVLSRMKEHEIEVSPIMAEGIVGWLCAGNQCSFAASVLKSLCQEQGLKPTARSYEMVAKCYEELGRVSMGRKFRDQITSMDDKGCVNGEAKGETKATSVSSIDT